VQGRLLHGFAGGFKPRDAQFAAFEFVAFAALRVEGLGCSDAGAQTTALSADVPFDAAISDRVPVLVAFGIAGDGKHLPAPANLYAFDDVDPRQNISPRSRILADTKGDRTWCR